MSTSTDLYRYATLSDIPLTGPDPFTDPQKDAALAAANARLEADVNDGEVIESPEQIHTHAVSTYATYVLVVGPKSPDSATLGDLSDEGARRMEFARELRQIYEDIVESIKKSGGDEGGGGWPVSVWTTRKAQRWQG